MQVSRDSSAVLQGAVLPHLEYPSSTLMLFLSSVFPNTHYALLATNLSYTSRAYQLLNKVGKVILDLQISGLFTGRGAHCSP